MAKKKIEIKTENISVSKPVTESFLDIEPITGVESIYQEVTGINAAEKLQKGGWQLVDCHLTPQGKVYKFKKGK